MLQKSVFDVKYACAGRNAQYRKALVEIIRGNISSCEYKCNSKSELAPLTGTSSGKGHSTYERCHNSSPDSVYLSPQNMNIRMCHKTASEKTHWWLTDRRVHGVNYVHPSTVFSDQNGMEYPTWMLETKVTTSPRGTIVDCCIHPLCKGQVTKIRVVKVDIKAERLHNLSLPKIEKNPHWRKES